MIQLGQLLPGHGDETETMVALEDADTRANTVMILREMEEARRR
jgi:hypothetical protein